MPTSTSSATKTARMIAPVGLSPSRSRSRTRLYAKIHRSEREPPDPERKRDPRKGPKRPKNRHEILWNKNLTAERKRVLETRSGGSKERSDSGNYLSVPKCLLEKQKREGERKRKTDDIRTKERALNEQ